jgi:hypothetical protein
MKKFKEKKVTIINLIKVLVSLSILWGMWGVIQLNKQLTIKDIAYDNVFSVVNKLEGYTVYLKEDGNYEPYLVLSKNYNGEGNVLLLRKYLLDEPRIYNKEIRWGAYYENSEIDQYLNTKFIKKLEGYAQHQLVMSNLEITDRSSIGSVGEETTVIPRKAFLLSHTEMALPNSGHAPKEGKRLLYNLLSISRAATTKNGEAKPYWLRTSYTEHDTTVWFIKENNNFYYMPLWDMSEKKLFELSVRPAFCVAKDTKLERKEGIEKGKKVFVLKEEKSKGENKK